MAYILSSMSIFYKFSLPSSKFIFMSSQQNQHTLFIFTKTKLVQFSFSFVCLFTLHTLVTILLYIQVQLRTFQLKSCIAVFPLFFWLTFFLFLISLSSSFTLSIQTRTATVYSCPLNFLNQLVLVSFPLTFSATH